MRRKVENRQRRKGENRRRRAFWEEGRAEPAV